MKNVTPKAVLLIIVLFILSGIVFQLMYALNSTGFGVHVSGSWFNSQENGSQAESQNGEGDTVQSPAVEPPAAGSGQDGNQSQGDAGTGSLGEKSVYNFALEVIGEHTMLPKGVFGSASSGFEGSSLLSGNDVPMNVGWGGSNGLPGSHTAASLNGGSTSGQGPSSFMGLPPIVGGGRGGNDGTEGINTMSSSPLEATDDQGSAQVPEPGTLLLFGVGLLGMIIWGSKRIFPADSR